MKKFCYIAIIVVFSFVFAAFTKAATGDLIVVYPSQWNIKVLDLKLTPATDDILNALTVKNLGLAPDSYLKEAILYKDDGDEIFEGWKTDEEAGKGIYYSDTGVYYWKDLNIAVPKEGRKFFVAVETKSNDYITVDRRTIQMSVPSKYDANNNGLFDFGTDTGVFMNSKDNGPASELISSETQTIYKKSIDVLAPKTVVIYPSANGKISDKNIIITGASRDQGGSAPSSAQINISKAGAENAVWSDVIATEANYSAWKFNWNNIEDGVYTIKTRATDWAGNTGEEAGITITADTAPTPQPSPEAAAGAATPTPSPTPSPSSSAEATAGEEVARILDGDLIRVNNTFDVYIVKIIGVKKFKRLILNPAIFNSYGHLKWENIKDVSQAAADSYNLSDLVIEANADGSIANPKVYRASSSAGADAGEKRWLNISAARFAASGLDWDSIYKINSAEASKNFYQEGAAIIL